MVFPLRIINLTPSNIALLSPCQNASSAWASLEQRRSDTVSSVHMTTCFVLTLATLLMEAKTSEGLPQSLGYMLQSSLLLAGSMLVAILKTTSLDVSSHKHTSELEHGSECVLWRLAGFRVQLHSLRTIDCGDDEGFVRLKGDGRDLGCFWVLDGVVGSTNHNGPVKRLQFVDQVEIGF